MLLSVIIVSWNVCDLLECCLRSVASEAAALSLPVETIVVDNASSDGTADRLRRAHPDVRLIASPRNLGFAAGCNLGLAAASGDPVLLLNPDAVLQPGALGALLRALEQHPRMGAAGPLLLDATGREQSSRRRFPSLANAFLESTLVQDHFPGLPWYRRYYCLDVSSALPQRVDWLVGACLLVRRAAIDATGPLDERFFMYFEEVDWFLRAAAAGWSAWYEPGARVVHLAGASSAKDPAARQANFLRSKAAFYRKHFGPVAGAAVHAFLLLDCSLRIVEDGLKLALGRKPALHRDRIALNLSALRRTVRP